MMSLIFLLALSPLIPLRGGPLFSFLLLNGALQSIVGAYMQTAIIGLASLFGPHAIRNVFTGQAAVGVVVSLVQYINTALSMRSGDRDDPSSTTDTGALSAFIFFGLSTAYLIVTLGAHTLLTHTSTYQLVKLSFAHPPTKRNTEGDEDESNHPSGSGPDPVIQVGKLEIAKLNATYNFAIAYVFVVTLVNLLLSHRPMLLLNRYLLNLVCFPSDHDFDPLGPLPLELCILFSTSLHHTPLPRIKCCRLVRPIPLLLPVPDSMGP